MAAQAITLGCGDDEALVAWCSKKAPRVAHGSFGGEAVAAVMGLERFYVLKDFVDETDGKAPSLLERVAWQCVHKEEWSSEDPGLQAEFLCDAEGVVKCVNAQGVTGEIAQLAKARKSDVFGLKEALEEKALSGFVHVKGQRNAVDVLTKEKSRTKGTQPLWWKVIRGEGLARE